MLLNQSGKLQADAARIRAKQSKEQLPDDCTLRQWAKATAWAKSDFVKRHRMFVSDSDRPHLRQLTEKELVQAIDFQREYAGRGLESTLDSRVADLLRKVEKEKTSTYAEYKEKSKQDARDAEYLEGLQEAVRRSRN